MRKSIREPIATWYRAAYWWNVRVRPVKVVAVTDKTVTYLDGTGRDEDEPPFRELRNNISTDDVHFFPTFEEAKAWCIQKGEEKVKQAQVQLEKQKGLLGNARGLTP